MKSLAVSRNIAVRRQTTMTNFCKLSDAIGSALILALLVLFLFSLLALYITLNATASLQISDNYESQLKATSAALSGLNHAGSLLRGLAFDDLLKGPDGSYDHSPLYLAQTKGFKFRLPLPLLTAQSLSIDDPADDVSALPDDGLINTGFCDGSKGIALIPSEGVAQVAPNPYGAGTITVSRYFVKVTDNSGESSELEGDSEDDPFHDGDRTVIVRSMGIAKALVENTGSIPRFNSVAVFEGRFRRLSTWDLGPALVVMGDRIQALFEGSYEISGGLSIGIGTIDASPGNESLPDQVIRAAVRGSGNITGAGQPHPSIGDITGEIELNRDQSLLLNPRYLWDFIHIQAPKIADVYWDGPQSWLNGSAPYAGTYDGSKPLNAPGQDPKITVVNGDLQISGEFTGGGLLIVTGDFSCSGPYAYTGLVLVLGSGSMRTNGSGAGFNGGFFIVNLAKDGEEVVFGAPDIHIEGNSRFVSNRDAVQMAIGA
jgi:hypothetical protein